MGMEKGLAEGVAQGQKQGMEKGIEKGQASMVRQLLNRFDEQEVAEMTGLDADAVRRLRGITWR